MLILRLLLFRTPRQKFPLISVIKFGIQALEALKSLQFVLIAIIFLKVCVVLRDLYIVILRQVIFWLVMKKYENF
jgi:hypothetical protein